MNTRDAGMLKNAAPMNRRDGIIVDPDVRHRSPFETAIETDPLWPRTGNVPAMFGKRDTA